MKISDNGFSVKNNISIGEYLLLVEAIVDFSFSRDESGKVLMYTPHYVTAGLPALVVNFCIDGVEADPNEVGYFSGELVNAINENEELRETVNNIINGCGIFNDEVPHYFYRALEDADKIIKVELEKLSPPNTFLIEANKLLRNLNDSLKDVDVKAFAENIEKILSANEAV